MKKTFQIGIALILALPAAGQQRPHYTQYILNQYILNPALSGIENYTDLKVSARDQWAGLDGAPRTMYLTVHAPIGKKDLKTTATSYQIPGENPRGSSYWENYTASEPHHGAGLSIVNDRTGLYNRFSANVSYAYHLGLSPRANMAAGFAAGIQKVSYDPAKASPASPLDPALGNTGADLYRVVPDLSAGVWLYGPEYFFGLSAQQVIPQKVALNDTLGSRLVPHLFATAGYRYLLNEDINALPSLMVKYTSGGGAQFDLNLKMQYHDLLWMGGSYRFQYGYAAMVGLNVGNTFNIGYAYDYSTTALRTVSRGTHEILVGFLIGNRFGDTCPRNVW